MICGRMLDSCNSARGLEDIVFSAFLLVYMPMWTRRRRWGTTCGAFRSLAMGSSGRTSGRTKLGPVGQGDSCSQAMAAAAPLFVFRAASSIEAWRFAASGVIVEHFAMGVGGFGPSPSKSFLGQYLHLQVALTGELQRPSSNGARGHLAALADDLRAYNRFEQGIATWEHCWTLSRTVCKTRRSPQCRGRSWRRGICSRSCASLPLGCGGLHEVLPGLGEHSRLPRACEL